MVGLGGGFLRLIALIIVAFGFAVKYAAWTMGIGAMILARLNRTPAGWQGSSVPVPAPAAPPAVPEPAGTPDAHPDALPLSEHWNEEERRWEEPGDEHRWEEPPPER
jgi:hypothetical protein